MSSTQRPASDALPAGEATVPSAEPFDRGTMIATILIASLAVFMTSLDNLIVGVALPSIRVALGGSMESLEWTVNAYTMAFAVTMIGMAAMGDRFGRRRVFSLGIAVFTLASAVAAVASSLEVLVAARAVQGFGAAAIFPLSLTLISGAVPPAKRSAAIGVWGGVSGLGVALGPFLGGAVVEGISWEWIFWLNVPIGLILIPLVYLRIPESRGPNAQLDLPGMILAGMGLFLLTFGVVRSPTLGWESPTVLATVIGGLVVLGGFVARQRVAPAPMLPLKFFRNRAFVFTNGLAIAMFFGIFGVIFLLSQFFQVVQGYGPFEAGAMTLPWTAMPMVVAPIAGAILYPRVGGRVLMVTGLALQSLAMLWMFLVIEVDTPYLEFIPAFVMAGVGMALVFSPSASMILESVRARESGQASGGLSTLREVGGVLGVAVMATVFQHAGSYASPESYTAGVDAALPVAVAVLAGGALLAACLPSKAQHDARVAEILELDRADDALARAAGSVVEGEAPREPAAAPALA